MATGKCVNIMRCQKAKNREIQDVDKANFVCTECGRPLVEVNQGPTPPKPGGGRTTTSPASSTPWVLIIGIIVAVALLGGGGYYAYSTDLFSNGVDEEETADIIPAAWVSIMDGEKITLKQGETKQLSLDCDPGDANDGVTWTTSNEDIVAVSNNGELTALSSGKAIVTVTTNVYKKTDEIQVVVKGDTTSTGDDGPTTLNLPYGKYTGKTKNGKPHGEGRLVYTKEHIINKHDVKKRKAQPGEYIQGQFVNGEITIGKHFDANGNLIQALNFGVAE